MSNFLLLLFGPCEVFRDIVGVGDCSGTRTWRLVLSIVTLIAVAVLLYVVSKGGIRAARPVTKWMHRVANRKVTEITDGELLTIGTFICALFLILALIMDGVSALGIWALIACSLVYVTLFVLRAGLRKEEKDPDRDIPTEVRKMSLEQLREEVQRRDLYKTIRSQMGSEGKDMFKTAKNLHDVHEEERHLAKQYPKLRKEIEIMAEIRKIQIKEKL